MARRNTLIIPVAIWSAVGVLAVVLMLPKVFNLFWPDSNLALVDRNSYQAVFLDNNQIYFGRLKNPDSLHPILDDVYYVQVGAESEKGQQTNKLVKLGDIEPHKPKNQMILNNQHILFWENMNFDSPVIQAIQKHNSEK